MGDTLLTAEAQKAIDRYLGKGLLIIASILGVISYLVLSAVYDKGTAAGQTAFTKALANSREFGELKKLNDAFEKLSKDAEKTTDDLQASGLAAQISAATAKAKADAAVQEADALLGETKALRKSIDLSKDVVDAVNTIGKEIETLAQKLAANPGFAEQVMARALPIGSIMAWHKSLVKAERPPPGWYECEGQTVTVGEGASAKIFALPDLNKSRRFLRGGTDSGKDEEDAFQGHWHNFYYLSDTNNGGDADPNDHLLKMDPPNKPDPLTVNVRDAISDGKNGQPRIADETRPKNMSVVWIIRMR